MIVKRDKQKLRIAFGEDGQISVAALCLKTDLWNDYREFLREAQLAVQTGNARRCNRYLRAGLLCLFGHVEGVINDVYRHLNFVDRRRVSLADRIRRVSKEAQVRGSNRTQSIAIAKQLRDLIAHPGIEKTARQRDGSKLTLDQSTPFTALTIENLVGLEKGISAWLDAVCAALDVPRFTDTEELVEWASDELRKQLGGGPAPIDEI